MALADSLRKVANKAIGKFGGDITIQSVSLLVSLIAENGDQLITEDGNAIVYGSYSPTTGTVTETITTETVKGVLEDVNASEVNGLVRADDKKLTVAASALSNVPGLDDKVVISSVTHQIVQINTVEQNNLPIIFDLFLRS